MIAAKKYNKAAVLFKLNVKFLPNSFKTYDSLEEAYELARNTKLAIDIYNKSVEMNPKNTIGLEPLTELKKIKCIPHKSFGNYYF